MKFLRLASLAIMLLALGCSSRLPTSIEGRLYYTVEEGGQYRIEWMDQFGENVHYVLGAYPKGGAPEPEDVQQSADQKTANDDKEQAREPFVSDDGRRMAYLWGSPPGVRIVNLVTRAEEMQIRSGDTYNNLSFDPFGKKIMYTRYELDSEKTQLLLQSYPAAPEILITSRIGIACASLSNFANLAYFSRLNSDGSNVFYSLKLDTKRQEKLFQNVSACRSAPKGMEVALVRDDLLQIYNASKKTCRVLVKTAGVSSPTWNPQGDTVAFVQNRQIFKVDAKGGTPELISEPNKHVVDVYWARGY